jgi:hypothetical protein
MSGATDARAARYGLSSRVRVHTVKRARKGLAAHEPDVRVVAARWAEAVLATAASPTSLPRRASMWFEVVTEAVNGSAGMVGSGDIYGNSDLEPLSAVRRAAKRVLQANG